jgi:hypothetical protein
MKEQAFHLLGQNAHCDQAIIALGVVPYNTEVQFCYSRCNLPQKRLFLLSCPHPPPSLSLGAEFSHLKEACPLVPQI